MSARTPESIHEAECETLRSIERSRLAALVGGDVERAAALHGADFQLITPVGMTLSKEQYLGAISAGALTYHAWEPGQIEVRLNEPVAVLRYRSSMEVTFGPHHVPRTEYWHTDLYERANGTWQVVWSQATAVQHRG